MAVLEQRDGTEAPVRAPFSDEGEVPLLTTNQNVPGERQTVTLGSPDLAHVKTYDGNSLVGVRSLRGPAITDAQLQVAPRGEGQPATLVWQKDTIRTRKVTWRQSPPQRRLKAVR